MVYCSKGKNERGSCKDGSETPTINQQAFPNTGKNLFWSGSPVAGNSGSAWYVSFGYGYSYIFNRYNDRAVRLVRGGQ